MSSEETKTRDSLYAEFVRMLDILHDISLHEIPLPEENLENQIIHVEMLLEALEIVHDDIQNFIQEQMVSDRFRAELETQYLYFERRLQFTKALETLMRFKMNIIPGGILPGGKNLSSVVEGLETEVQQRINEVRRAYEAVTTELDGSLSISRPRSGPRPSFEEVISFHCALANISLQAYVARDVRSEPGPSGMQTFPELERTESLDSNSETSTEAAEPDRTQRSITDICLPVSVPIVKIILPTPDSPCTSLSKDIQKSTLSDDKEEPTPSTSEKKEERGSSTVGPGLSRSTTVSPAVSEASTALPVNEIHTGSTGDLEMESQEEITSSSSSTSTSSTSSSSSSSSTSTSTSTASSSETAETSDTVSLPDNRQDGPDKPEFDGPEKKRGRFR